MPIIMADDLETIAREVLLAAGGSAANAAVVAEHLVRANLSGVDTHGVWHLPGYVEHLANGWIDGTAQPAVLKEGSNSALVSGHWTFGQVAARYATELGIRLALEREVAVVGLVQCHHIGRLGHYPEMAAEAGVLTQVWAGGYSEEAPAAMPYGGRSRLLHTNPISMGFPAGSEPAMVFDYATTVLAGVKVDNARRRGEALPPGAIVDREGRPTTDPDAFFEGGGHVQFGGHKGYALSMAAEFLGRIFTGANAFADPARGGPVLRNQGATFVFMRHDLLASSGDYRSRADEMERRTRAVPPAPGHERVMVPGDPESLSRATRLAQGIPVEEGIWEQVARLPRRSA